MSLYKKILENKEYLDLTSQIGQMKFITDGQWDWEHGLGHFKRVTNHVKSFLTQLECDDRTIDLGMTAALLHDIGLSKNEKKDHALKSAQMLKKFLYDTDITSIEFQVIKQAIADHSKGENINSLIGAALILADKLDITYHRVENSSIMDKRNKEIKKIISADVIINESNLIINYETDKDFKPGVLFEIFKDWKKPLIIPHKVAKYLNKSCIFMINNEIIQITYT